MKIMCYGIYKCPVCGHHNIVLSRKSFSRLSICVTDEAIGYHLYGERAPKRYYLGFKGSVICKKCNKSFEFERIKK